MAIYRRALKWPWLLPILFGALALLWFHEHDAQVRRKQELEQFRKQSAVAVAELEARAEAALREASDRTRLIQGFESQRRELTREAEGLRKRLAELQAKERTDLEQVATLPTHEVATRVAAQLGAEATVNYASPPASAEIRKPKVETRDARAAGEAATSPADALRLSPSDFRLTEAGVRKVAAALIELDSCREQAAVKGAQVAKCGEQLAADAAVMEQQTAAMGKLREAAVAKDQILARREAEMRAELKAARGPWLRRFLRAAEYVGVGVAIGVVIR